MERKKHRKVGWVFVAGVWIAVAIFLLSLPGEFFATFEGPTWARILKNVGLGLGATALIVFAAVWSWLCLGPLKDTWE